MEREKDTPFLTSLLSIILSIIPFSLLSSIILSSIILSSRLSPILSISNISSLSFFSFSSRLFFPHPRFIPTIVIIGL